LDPDLTEDVQIFAQLLVSFGTALRVVKQQAEKKSRLMVMISPRPPKVKAADILIVRSNTTVRRADLEYEENHSTR
jgi:hypothetical protein